MKPLRTIVITLSLIACSMHSFSQDFPFGKILLDEIEMKSYIRDTTANAVVLKEFGNAYIASNNEITLVFEYHTKIKILKTKGIENANIEIPVYKSDNNRFEEVFEVVGSTFSAGVNGGFQETKLDPKKIFRENKNKHWDLLKFAMPDVRPGSVIEYSYKLKSPYLFNFHSWLFQAEIPKISSEYVVTIPSMYNYNVTLRGALQLAGNPKMELLKECFEPGGGIKSDCSKITYSMSNIPALVPEDYMTAMSNFQSAINFELRDYKDYDLVTHKMTQEWKDVDLELRKSDYFGDAMHKKNILKDLPVKVAVNADDLGKAKTAFYAVQHWFRWNHIYGYNTESLNKAIDSKAGTSADINLSLIAVLNALGLNTEAVLLSTRENGMVSKVFPVLSEFNYVIAKVNIGTQSYLLDATDPLLPFGLLPVRCINDQGRVINFEKPSYWMDMKPSDKLGRTRVLDLALQENGKIKGTITTFSMGYEAYNKRTAIKKFNSTNEYVENLDESMPKLKILKSEITNLDSIELALGEKYEVEIDAYDELQNGFIFNPIILDKIAENPFKLTERSYPVDLGAPIENRVTLNMTFPDKFEIISKPEAQAAGMVNSGGRFITSISNSDKDLAFSQAISLTKPIYAPEEYPYLKEFYNKIVQSQKADIIFRKKQ